MTAPPELLPPMLATPGPLPQDPGAWAFELKWDGIRAVARWHEGRLRLHSRNRRDITVSWPELHGLGASLPATSVVLDGEIVAFDEEGRPSFQRLQPRMHVADPATAAQRATTVPAVYLVFDVLHVGDQSLLDEPWTERRRALEGLGVAGPAWALSPAFPGEGEVTLRAAADRGLEGVIAKRADSAYQPGRRSAAWRKVKLVLSDEFVVGGWVPGKRGRQGRIGSLLLGQPTADGRLRFVGGVGTGFTEAELRRLAAELTPDVVDESPFDGPVPRKDAAHVVYVRPRLVVEVVYTERTKEGILRHPSYKGQRIDKSPADVDTVE